MQIATVFLLCITRVTQNCFMWLWACHRSNSFTYIYRLWVCFRVCRRYAQMLRMILWLFLCIRVWFTAVIKKYRLNKYRNEISPLGKFCFRVKLFGWTHFLCVYYTTIIIASFVRHNEKKKFAYFPRLAFLFLFLSLLLLLLQRVDVI